MRFIKIIICGIIVCLMLTCAACGGDSASSDPEVSATVQPTLPNEVLSAYFVAISAQDYETMYRFIGNQSDVSKEDFISRNKNIYEGIEANNIEIEIGEESSGDVLSFQVNMDTQAGHLSFSNLAQFIKSDGEYKLVWDSTLIFPDLTDEDKVRVETIQSERGNILDRNGEVLAGQGELWSVGFVPGKMNAETREADIIKVAEALNMTPEKIKEKLSEKWVKDDLFVPLKNITKTDTQTEEKLLEVKGIGLSTVQGYVYTLGKKAAHLTGYIRDITKEELDERPGEGYDANSKIGKVGLEYLLEERLRSFDGYKIYIVDKDDNEKVTLAELPAQNGEDVMLTIDKSLQEKLYDSMADDTGTGVVMNPKTGEILALVSTPSYDPNDFLLGMSEEKWAAYNDEETRPMYNRFKSTFVPGSSFKPVTAALGLTSGAFTAQESFGTSGTSWGKDTWDSYTVTTIKQYSGDANVLNALIYSDNIYFAKAALKMGETTFGDGLIDIGFGEQLPFEFGLKSSSFGKDLAFVDEIRLADSGYGQGRVLVNPIHLASIYSAFVNEGDMIAPHLEKRQDSQILKQSVFSADAAQTVRKALIQAVENENGTGHEFKIDGRTLAGKTGTAEIKDTKDDTEGTELGWFVAFTADEGDQLLAAVMIEDVKGRGGSHYVIPIVRSLFTN